jgi:hypothetical protein
MIKSDEDKDLLISDLRNENKILRDELSTVYNILSSSSLSATTGSERSSLPATKLARDVATITDENIQTTSVLIQQLQSRLQQYKLLNIELDRRIEFLEQQNQDYQLKSLDYFNKLKKYNRLKVEKARLHVETIELSKIVTKEQMEIRRLLKEEYLLKYENQHLQIQVKENSAQLNKYQHQIEQQNLKITGMTILFLLLTFFVFCLDLRLSSVWWILLISSKSFKQQLIH